MDAAFSRLALPGAQMIWADAQGVWVDPKSAYTPKDMGDGWMRQRGLAAFVSHASGRTTIEIIRLVTEDGVRGKVCVLDAASGRKSLEDSSFRRDPRGSELFKQVRALFPAWSLIWMGAGSATPACVITRDAEAGRLWAFARLGPGNVYVEVDRQMSLPKLIDRAGERAAA